MVDRVAERAAKLAAPRRARARRCRAAGGPGRGGERRGADRRALRGREPPAGPRPARSLVEKPIAATLDEADALISSRARGRILQVGHLERFNAALVALADVLREPLFIESHRLAPFQPRGTDVDVVLDLMIHDIDLIQQLVGRPLAQVEAVGVPVLSARLDIANARLGFEGGCVANVTASRASLKSERKMRLFQKDAYVSIDFQAGAVTIARKGAGEMFPGVPAIELERGFAANDSLKREIEAFLAAIRGERPVAVSGEDGRRALDTALRITALRAAR